MKRTLGLAAAVGLLVGATQAQGQSVVFDFQDGTDQGFGTGFGNDASATLPIANIGGSLRMTVPSTPSFQEAGRESQGSDAFLAAINAAILNPAGYLVNYDWYVDTSLSPGNYGSFLQLGTYLNSGAGGYVQDFPGTGKDMELNGVQLASGLVFSGTVSETLTQKYGTLPATFDAQTFMRFGVVINGDGTAATVYFDNISVTPIPEPASLSLLALAVPALWMIRRRRSTSC